MPGIDELASWFARDHEGLVATDGKHDIDVSIVVPAILAYLQGNTHASQGPVELTRSKRSRKVFRSAQEGHGTKPGLGGEIPRDKSGLGPKGNEYLVWADLCGILDHDSVCRQDRGAIGTDYNGVAACRPEPRRCFIAVHDIDCIWFELGAQRAGESEVTLLTQSQIGLDDPRVQAIAPQLGSRIRIDQSPRVYVRKYFFFPA